MCWWSGLLEIFSRDHELGWNKFSFFQNTRLALKRHFIIKLCYLKLKYAHIKISYFSSLSFRWFHLSSFISRCCASHRALSRYVSILSNPSYLFLHNSFPPIFLSFHSFISGCLIHAVGQKKYLGQQRAKIK